MKANYFSSVDALSNHVQNIPADCFAIQPQPRACGCGTVRIAYEVTDRQDNDIMEILVVCPLCAKKSVNNQ
ncbi:MAG: hypothetical protein LBS55_03200 [Prevotellaceae bacterium]|jgi:hypothetical protein|nr:hypothetical protein [Prevotellaceae bacterium]